MATLADPEGLHIGREMARHAGQLGVTVAMMEVAAGRGNGPEVRWVTEMDHPSILRMRRLHFLMIEAYETAPEPLFSSVPFREQWFTTRYDQLLYGQLKRSGRKVVWWWGPKRLPDGTGAYCHVCELPIHRYDLAHGVTHTARLAVMQHRATHVAELLKRPSAVTIGAGR